MTEIKECPHCKALREERERKEREERERLAREEEMRKLESETTEASTPKHEKCCCHEHHHEEGEVKMCTCGKHANDEDKRCTCKAHHHEHEDGDTGCSCGCGMDFKEHKEENCGCGVDHKHTSNKTALIKLIVSFVAVVLSYVLTATHVYDEVNPWFRLLDTAWISIILSGIPIYRGAIKNLIKRKGVSKITSALLVSLAMTASIIMGFLSIAGVTEGVHGHQENYFFASGEVAFLMALGKFIEQITVGKSRSAVKELIQMKPLTANLKTPTGYIEVKVEDIKVGDVVLVRPNDIITIDGEVVFGSSAVDTSGITGENAPQDVTIGDAVYMGTRNLSGAIEIRATKRIEDTTFNRLIDYVKNAEKKKAPIVQHADKWASYLVPSACVISIVIFFIALFAMHLSVIEAVSRAITILVVVCPCALTLATPIAVSAGIGNAGKKGILIKSGVAVEALAKVKKIAFDKTGTLTEGNLIVSEVKAVSLDKDSLLRYAASAENFSEHPIGKAIVASYDGELLEVENTESIVGKGVRATVAGKDVRVVKLSEVDVTDTEREELLSKGATVIAVIIDEELAGFIALNDSIRDGVNMAIRELKDDGYSVVMLTGDNAISARNVAKEIGVEEYKAELLPEDKAQYVLNLNSTEDGVMMVGDGVNDAPALTSASCSVAMGAMGSSVAIETADVALMTSDVKRIPFLMRLSKRVFKTIKINIIMSLSISFISIFLSLFGILDAVSGALVHNAGSVLVCLHSAFLLAFHGKKK